jgi:hypothetical protein
VFGGELDWRAKVELYEQIRREYEYGAGTTGFAVLKVRVYLSAARVCWPSFQRNLFLLWRIHHQGFLFSVVWQESGAKLFWNAP